MANTKSTNVLAVIQARMSSVRLPGKVLRLIMGRPMLELMVERVRRCRMIDRVIVATSEDESDDPLQEFCENSGIDCFRGSLHDVLDRFYQTARVYQAANIVRLTGDCPVIDPELTDKVIALHLQGGYDISALGACDTYPDGLDVSVVTFAALEKTWREASLPSEREHVTSHIFNHPEVYSCGVIQHEQKLGHLRWSVDEPADFELITRIYQELYPENPGFLFADILQLLNRQPDLMNVNAHIMINEGYQKSLKQDAAYLAARDNGEADK